jgi:hypothetical protein
MGFFKRILLFIKQILYVIRKESKMAVEWSKVLFKDDNDIGDVTGDSLILNDLTASLPVFTNGSKALVSNTMTGTGKVVMDTSPTISAPTISGHPVIEGVTPTGATGTGKLVFDTSPTLTSLTLSDLSASLPVFTDGSKNLVSKSIADTQTALGFGEWTDYSGTTVVVGFSLETIKVYYKSFPEYCLVHFEISGTSDADVFTFTLPPGLISKNTVDTAFCVANCADNSSIGGSGFGNLQKASTTVVLYYATWGGAWTASGAKAATGNFWFPT